MDQGFFIHEISQINDKSTDDIFDKIAKIEQSLCRLKAETSNLQRYKDQFQIYLQVYQDDYESLKRMYLSLKDRMNAQNSQFDAFQSSLQSVQKVPQEVPPNDSNNTFQDAIIMGPSTGNALSHIKLSYSVKSTDPFYNENTVKLRYALDTSNVICSVQFDSTGSRFAFADGRTLFLINTADGSLLASFDIPHTLSQTEVHTRALIFTPDDNYIIISETNFSILVFSIQTRSIAATLKEHKALVSSLLYLPEKNQLISGGFDGALCIWDMNTMTLVKKILHGPTDDEKKTSKDHIVSLAAAYDWSFIAVGFMDGSVGFYDPTFTQPMNTFNAHTEIMLSVVTAHRSLLIATSSHDASIKIWALLGVASCKRTLTGHKDCVLTSCFSPDDKILLSGSKDETIKGWDHIKGEVLFTIETQKNTLFEIDHHPTEKYFVSCTGDGIVCLWEYKTKE